MGQYQSKNANCTFSIFESFTERREYSRDASAGIRLTHLGRKKVKLIAPINPQVPWINLRPSSK